ncbi:MAG: transketolase [Actinomycetota bacterium]|nr:transketolase [Actinomycetota bacterium]
MNNMDKLQEICKLIRYYILKSTTLAGSGHPTSSLSAVELTAGLMFGGFFKYRVQDPDFANNDRLIFSKGHASPLLYALWTVAGAIKEEQLWQLRQFESNLEGHPTKSFKYGEAATGSLGQGLSIGVGMALNAKYLDMLPYKTFVLLGDSEMAEGSIWEAVQLASHYHLDNLVGIIDVNGLGQSGWTMHGHQTQAYTDLLTSFGWQTIQINGHNLEEVLGAYNAAIDAKDKPVMIIAKTSKGKGISFLADKLGWHGKALNEKQLREALSELGEIKYKITAELNQPEDLQPYQANKNNVPVIALDQNKMATRKAYGIGLVNIFHRFPHIVALDGEVSNSTYSETFKNHYPNHYFEMFIAEQNMVGVALGLSLRGKIPFVSSFAAFLTRAFDQIRMSQYSNSNIKFIGSHAGVSIGEDGPSQMGLEDIAMFRTNLEGVVLYPSDAVSTVKLIEQAARHKGNVYIRTTRMDTPIIYDQDTDFIIGGSQTVKSSPQDQVTVCAAGITLHQAVKAYYSLKKEGIAIRIVDVYSIKPVDYPALLKAQQETKAIITVEDHYREGGLGEAVLSALSQHDVPIYLMAVEKMPKSGNPEQLMDFEGISSQAIVDQVKKIVE